jgi:hypothetical protein
MEFTQPENILIASLKSFKNKILDKKATIEQTMIEQTMQYFVKNLKLNMRWKQLDIPEVWNTGIEEMLQNPEDPNNENIMNNLIKQLAKANGIIVLDDEDMGHEDMGHEDMGHEDMEDEDLDDEDLDEEQRKNIGKEYSRFEKKVLDSFFDAITIEPEIEGGKRRKTRKRKRGKPRKHMRSRRSKK